MTALALFGLNFSAVQYLAVYGADRDRRKQEEVVRSCLLLVVVGGLVTGAAVFWLADFISLRVFRML